jgi:hypothetical protein
MNKKTWPHTLGDTADEVAKTLLEQGVRGIPGDKRNCIIARSYKHTYPNGWPGMYACCIQRYKDSKGEFRYSARLTFDDIQIMDPECPPQVAEFMYKFDQCEYPELINKPIPKKEEVLSQLTIEQRIALGY